MKVLAYIVGYCIYFLSFLSIRSKKCYAFGGARRSFSDNSKYLFIYMSEHYPDLNVYWISGNRQTVERIRAIGKQAYYKYAAIGIWKALRAKYWFYNTYSEDIAFFLSGGATLVNLWHGVGLKRCEFNIIHEGPLADRYVRHTFHERFYYPQCFQRPSYVLSSTEFQSKMFASAFRISINQCLNLGYPRNSLLLQSKEAVRAFVEKYEPSKTKELIDQLSSYNKVYIYMPTLRDSQLEIFTQNMDLERMSKVLRLQNAILLLKPHPNSIIDNIFQSDNVKLIDNSIDVYGILPFTDVLITDYSSILYDYILMSDKQVILYLYDYDDYVRERDFYYPFEENIVGKQVASFEELLQAISSQDFIMQESERYRILDKFWGDTMQHDVCESILKRVAGE